MLSAFWADAIIKEYQNLLHACVDLLSFSSKMTVLLTSNFSHHFYLIDRNQTVKHALQQFDCYGIVCPNIYDENLAYI